MLGRPARFSAQRHSPSRQETREHEAKQLGHATQSSCAASIPVWHYIIAVTLEPRSRAGGPDSGPGVDDRGGIVWSDCKV